MSRVILALGSFAVGAVSTLFISSLLVPTSTRVHAQEQQTSPLAAAEQSFIVDPATGKLTPFSFKPAEPVVPTSATSFTVGFGFTGRVPLDGFTCDSCTLLNADLTYAGGVYSLRHARLSIRSFTLKGAALNTFNMLRLLGIIPSPTIPPKKLNAPREQLAEIPINTKNAEVTWVSQVFLEK